MRKIFCDTSNLIRFITVRFIRDRCAQTAASLAFTTLMALVPMITIALTAFSAFPAFGSFSAQIKLYLLNNLMPEDSGVIVAKYMQQFAESATRLTAVGIVILVITAMLLLMTIDKTFNIIWRVNRPRPLIKRMVVYWAVLTLAPLLVGASLSLTSWLVDLSAGHGTHIPAFGIMILRGVPIVFSTLAFALLFRLVPNRHVPKRHALMGAFFSAVLFQAMSRIFGYYISHFPTYTLVYGAFASVPVLLMWIYLSWLVILLGAVIAASLSYWRTPAEQDVTPVSRLLDALRVMQLMGEGLQIGAVYDLQKLSKSLRLGYDLLEAVLDKLADADLVRRVEGNGWLLMRDLGQIRATELWYLFVLEGGKTNDKQRNAPLQNWLAACNRQFERSSDITLRELFVQQGA